MMMTMMTVMIMMTVEGTPGWLKLNHAEDGQQHGSGKNRNIACFVRSAGAIFMLFAYGCNCFGNIAWRGPCGLNGSVKCLTRCRNRNEQHRHRKGTLLPNAEFQLLLLCACARNVVWHHYDDAFDWCVKKWWKVTRGRTAT